MSHYFLNLTISNPNTSTGIHFHHWKQLDFGLIDNFISRAVNRAEFLQWISCLTAGRFDPRLRVRLQRQVSPLVSFLSTVPWPSLDRTCFVEVDGISNP